MADATTTRYGIVKPEVGASADTWGTKCNQDFDDLDAIGGAIITTGSGAAYVLTTGLSLAAYVAGQSFLINPSFTCNAAATVNVDGLGAKNITKNGTTATVSGDIVSGRIRRITYDGTQFQTNVSQSEDATTTALAALSWSSGNALVQFTAADTVSLTLTPSVTSITVSGIVSAPDGSAAAPSIKVGDEQNGLFSGAANSLDFATGGTHRWRLNSSGNLVGQASGSSVFAADGTVSGTGLGFYNDLDCGWYRIGANNWAGAVGGSKIIEFASTGIKDASGNILRSSGKTTLPIPASAMVANTTNGPSSGTTETTTNKVMVRTLDFDTTTQESAQFCIPMPKGWDEGTVTFQPIWTASAGTAADTVVWDCAGVALSDDDALDTAFGTVQTSSDVLIATGDTHIGPESSAITIAGTPAEGDIVFFRVRRVPASDNLPNDAKLIGIRLNITTNAANDV